MNLAILHYHLNRGGVTQVIANHLLALDASDSPSRPERVALVFGGRRQEWPNKLLPSSSDLDLQMIEIPGLDYDPTFPAEASAGDAACVSARPDELAAELAGRLEGAGFSADSTILHVHNHALGKNVSLPGALRKLSEAGYRMLLQIHDFPEDIRPENYARLAESLTAGKADRLPDILYPQSPGIHYAVLNHRDQRILSAAGVSADRLHLVPNAVGGLEPPGDRAAAREVVAFELNLAPDERLIVYPVRGIRRKNVGEMLLLAALDPRPARYTITLAPLNPAELGSYQHWRGLAAELDLPCQFGSGASGRLQFDEILGAADALLTTSLAEGFGMVFLESWLVEQQLVGRDLPEITCDFVECGIRFEHLYDRLRIPISLIDMRAWRAALRAAFESACATYGRSESPENVDRQIDQLVIDDTVDFAYLDVVRQEELIKAVVQPGPAREAVTGANPLLETIWTSASPELDDTIRGNRKLVTKHFGRDDSARQLLDVYRALLEDAAGGPPQPLPEGAAILDGFLSVAQLHPIRLDPCRR